MSIRFRSEFDAATANPAPTPVPLSDEHGPQDRQLQRPRQDWREGRESHIYAVQDQKTKQVWALKYVVGEEDKDARFIEQVEREYEIGSKFDHPSIRSIIKLIRHRKLFKTTSVSLIMELVDAVSLDQRLPNDAIGAVKLFRQVAEGLLHMHGRGYVHADIKPTNVLVTAMRSNSSISASLGFIGTVKKRIQGTPGYMAPEQRIVRRSPPRRISTTSVP